MQPRLEVARQNMVENQVRPWEVLDARVLGVLSSLPRELFVPQAYAPLAYADLALPIGYDEVMLKPVVEGRILQAMVPVAHEKVLEVGTGSGYFGACLARLSAEVTSVDRRGEFVEAAARRWEQLAIGNIEGLAGDALSGFSPGPVFDAIAVTGAVAALPPIFADWLKPGGRIFVIRGVEPAMQAVLLRRAADGGWAEERLFETAVPYLAGAEPLPQFRL